MDALVISSIGVCIAVALGVAYALRRASSACQLPATIDWIDELSVERYRPILRLLGGEDIRFLRDQPGCTPAMVTRLRAQRCQIFKGYLRDLQGDFDQVCGALKLLLVQSDHDRPDLAATLMRARFQFCVGVSMARVQVQLFRWGVGDVDVADLLKIFTSMHVELRALVPAGAGAMA